MTKNHTRVLALVVATALLSPVAARAQKVAPAAKPLAQRGVVPAASRPAPQGFSVVLVLGEMQGNGATDSVPPAARKALDDMKDFLPYKSYRFLDTQWTLCCGHSATVTRLRGADEQDYDLELGSSSTGADGKWAVRFTLVEPAPAGAPSEASSVEQAEWKIAAVQREELEARIRTLREREQENHPDVQRVHRQIAELEHGLSSQRRALAARAKADRSRARAIIETSFTMDIGETVVVGTSRLKGDKALIALLTAVPSTKTTTR